VKSLTPAGELLASEIARSGPIRFSRFMEVALYHPEFGYYRRSKDPFGADGDFYTAEQLQPVFGRLMATYLRMLALEARLHDPVTVLELGAGRGDMAMAFGEFDYVPVEIGRGELPQSFTGIVFSNEFFDAQPVDVIAGRAGRTVELRVDFDGDRFHWVEWPVAESSLEEGVVREVQTERLLWIERIDRCLVRGFVVTIDYGFTGRELIRFPQGTLMSYRRHRALEDVLADPGMQDITAHVAFSEMQERGESHGWTTITFESLARTLMRAGEADQFERALAGTTEAERAKHRLQLKTLVFGMGETFRVLVQKKG
jgi:SAM-dependent MidA family methyltransferase